MRSRSSGVMENPHQAVFRSAGSSALWTFLTCSAKALLKEGLASPAKFFATDEALFSFVNRDQMGW
jgi:hypothetical protein